MRPLVLPLILGLVAGCAPLEDENLDAIDGVDDQIWDGKSDIEGASENDVEGVLRLVNDPATNVRLIDVEVGLDNRIAHAVVAHRQGPDGLDGTADDDPFDGLKELDAIPNLGPICFRMLVRYARAHGLVPGGTPSGAVCPSGTTTLGVDVSQWQDTIDWDRVKADGVGFAFIRSNDGLSRRDSTFARNWAEAKRVGIVRGAYQFFEPTLDPVAQADFLLEIMGPLGPDDLPPVLDVEDFAGASRSRVADGIHRWMERIESATGRQPIIYTSSGLWAEGVRSGDFVAYPLWIAHFDAACPRLATPWTSWAFWQKSDSGRIHGISGDVDLDVFNGDLAALQAFTLSH